MNKHQCKICDKIYKSVNGLPVHINQTHNMTSEEYYITYYLDGIRPKCPICGSVELTYLGFLNGFRDTCSVKCRDELSHRKSGLSDNKVQILELYNIGKTVKQISDDLCIDYSLVYNFLRRENLETRQDRNLRRNIFSNYNKESAYILGMLLSDGTFTYPQVGLGLQIKDINYLYKFRGWLNSSNVISKIYDKRYKKINMATFSFTARQMFSDLERYWGLTRNQLKRKTYNLGHGEDLIKILLEKELFFHFLRGLTDGDGSVEIRKEKGRFTFRWNVTGHPDFIKNVRKAINDSLFNGRNRGSIGKRENNFSVTLAYHGNRVAKLILENLYQDCEEYFLLRKKQTYDLGVNLIKLKPP